MTAALRELLKGTFSVYPGGDKSVAMTSKAKLRKASLPKSGRHGAQKGLRLPEGEMTGQALIELLQQSPLRDLCIEFEGVRMPVRDVEP